LLLPRSVFLGFKHPCQAVTFRQRVRFPARSGPLQDPRRTLGDLADLCAGDTLLFEGSANSLRIRPRRGEKQSPGGDGGEGVDGEGGADLRRERRDRHRRIEPQTPSRSLGELPQGGGEPALGGVVHGRDAAGIQGQPGVPGDPDSRVFQVALGLPEVGIGQEIPQPFRPLPGQDSGGLYGDGLGQQQAVPRPGPARGDQTVPRRQAE